MFALVRFSTKQTQLLDREGLEAASPSGYGSCNPEIKSCRVAVPRAFDLLFLVGMFY